jgi:citronellol/citronellal dehydrogenase
VHFGDVADWTLKRFDLVMSVNVRATFVLTRALLPSMRERARARAGAPAGTSEASGPAPAAVAMIAPPVHPGAAAHKAPYLASKAGMTMLALALAEEERERGIAAFSLWPATMIETAATIRHGLGERSQWRRPAIVADALLALCARPLAGSSGRAWTDEQVLLEEGVADLSVYDCVPGSEPPPLSLQWVSE